jgi:hypothetical protein
VYKPIVSDRSLEKIEKFAKFTAGLVVQLLELVIWGWITWLIAGQLDVEKPFFDFVWMSGLVIFGIRFSSALHRGGQPR